MSSIEQAVIFQVERSEYWLYVKYYGETLLSVDLQEMHQLTDEETATVVAILDKGERREPGEVEYELVHDGMGMVTRQRKQGGSNEYRRI